MTQKKFSPEENIPELDRMEMAILIVLYERHPMAMTQDAIIQIIEERRLLEMSDKEFKTYKENIIKAKRN